MLSILLASSTIGYLRPKVLPHTSLRTCTEPLKKPFIGRNYYPKGSKNMPCVVPWQSLSVFLGRCCCGLVPRSRASVVHWATWAEAADDDGESRDDAGHDDGEGDDHGNSHVNFQHRVNNHVSAAPTIAVATLWKKPRLGFCTWFSLFTE